MLASFTNDRDLAAAPTRDANIDEVVAYLNADPRHAVVINAEAYVLRGAGESLNDFFWGEMPAEDPNDANGGDLTAAAAVWAALDHLNGA